MTNEEETTDDGSIDRRSMLRKAAIGGAAVVWATPVVQTLGMGVAAANTGLQLQGCPTPDGARHKPSYLQFTYQPNTCAGSSSTMTTCSGNTPTTNATLSARVRNPDEKILKTNEPVSPGDTVIFDSGGCSGANDKGLGNNLEVTIVSDSGTQIFEFHTSCSSPLTAGDRYASLILQGGIFEC